MEGGYDVECLGEVSKDLFCMICLKLMKNTVVMKCGHGMCRACFNNLCTSSVGRNVFLQCPSCRKRLSSNEVSPIPLIDRIISALTVKCENCKHGCSWTGQIETINAHLKICGYSLVVCPEEHCSEMIPKCLVQDHLANTCLHSTVQCIYYTFGCDMKIVRQAMDDHLDKYSAEHLQLASEKLLTKEKEIEALTKENQALKRELQQAKQNNKKIHDFQIQLQKANEEHKKLSIELENSISEIATLEEKLKMAILKLGKVDQYHFESKEYGQIGIEAREVTIKEVVEGIRLGFLKGYKNGYKITNELVSQSKAEYFRLAKCLETQVFNSMDNLATLVNTGVKFSSSYWDGITVSLKDWFMNGILKQFQLIWLCCTQLLYIQDHEMKDLIPSVMSIKVGDCNYVKVNCSTTDNDVNFESPCKTSFYRLSRHGLLNIYLSNAYEVSLCSFTTLEVMKGKMTCQWWYEFHLTDGFKKDSAVILKFKMKNQKSKSKYPIPALEQL